MDLLTQMATFVRVVDGQSLSAAARALRLSLPAVSRQLSALEAELGTPLIVRSTRRLHVTDAGRRWYEHCIRVLRQVELAREEVREDGSVSGSLVVSVSLTFGQAFVVPRLKQLSARHPRLTIDLRMEDRFVDLVGEGVDLAVRAGTPPPDSTAYIGQSMLSMRRILVAAPRWLRKHGTPREPQGLARVDALIQITPAGVPVRWLLQRKDRTHTAHVEGTLRVNAPLALRDLAVAGAGVAYLPDWLVREDLENGRLRRVLPAWASPPVEAWAIYRAELRGAPRLHAFLQALTPATR